MDRSNNETLSKLLPFWDSLTSDNRDAILSSAHYSSFGKDTMVHSPQQPCSGLLVVKRGRICVYLLGENGREATLMHLNTEDKCVLTANALFPQIKIELHMQAEINTEVYVIPTSVLLPLMKNDLLFNRFVGQSIASAFSSSVEQLQRSFFFDLDTRIVRFLLDEQRTTLSFTLHNTHENIARHIGSSREVVSRGLRRLAELGVIETRRGAVVISDLDRLTKMGDYYK